MNIFKKSFFALGLLLAMSMASLNAQNNLDQLFEEGIIQYRNGNYQQAQLRFMEVLSAPKPNPLITSGYLMMAKTSQKMQQSGDAIEYADQLIKNFPQSRYVADAHFVRAAVNYNLGKSDRAFEDLVWAIEKSLNPELTKKCELYATQLIRNEVGYKTLKNFYSATDWKKSDPLFLLWLARKAYEKGLKGEGDQFTDKFLAAYPDHRFAEVAKRLKNSPISQISLKIRVGLLLPMSGLFSNEAADLLRGMIFSLKNRQQESPEFEIILKDTKGSNVETIKATLSLLNSDVNLLVGELESAKSSAIAGLAAQANLPLLIPVATENGLSTIGPDIFQMNNDLETRGIKLAQYAFGTLNLKTLATLAPADEYGHALTDAFLNEYDKLGGTVVSQQWYYPGTQDFKFQFDAIRESGIRFALRDSIAAMGLEVTPQRLDSLFRAEDRSVKSHSEDLKGIVESYDIPVTSIDGLFMPTYEEDIEIVAPQFALSNVTAQPLGGDYWNNDDLLRKQRNYLNGTVFMSGNFISETDIEYRNFVNKFRKATSASPGTMALYGYNVMNLLSAAIDKGYTQPEEIKSYLENVTNFKGLGASFSFSPRSHANQCVNILQFLDGNVYDVFSKEYKSLMLEKE